MTARGMPSVNTDALPTASIDGIGLGESVPSGFISVGAASSMSILGVTAKARDEMDERQLSTQVCFRLVGEREI